MQKGDLTISETALLIYTGLTILSILCIDVSDYRSIGARTMLPYSVHEPS